MSFHSQSPRSSVDSDSLGLADTLRNPARAYTHPSPSAHSPSSSHPSNSPSAWTLKDFVTRLSASETQMQQSGGGHRLALPPSRTGSPTRTLSTHSDRLSDRTSTPPPPNPPVRNASFPPPPINTRRHYSPPPSPKSPNASFFYPPVLSTQSPSQQPLPLPRSPSAGSVGNWVSRHNDRVGEEETFYSVDGGNVSESESGRWTVDHPPRRASLSTTPSPPSPSMSGTSFSHIPGGYVTSPTSATSSAMYGGGLQGYGQLHGQQGYSAVGQRGRVVGQVGGVPVVQAPPLPPIHPPRSSSRPSSPSFSSQAFSPSSPSYATARSSTPTSYSRALSPSGGYASDSDADDIPRFSPTTPRAPSPLGGATRAGASMPYIHPPRVTGFPRPESPTYAAPTVPTSFLNSVGLAPTRSPPRPPVAPVVAGATEAHPDGRLLREDPRALETGRPIGTRSGRRASMDGSRGVPSYPPQLASGSSSTHTRPRSPERSSMASLGSLVSSLASPVPIDFRDVGTARAWLAPFPTSGPGGVRRSDTLSSRASAESAWSGLSGISGGDGAEDVGRGVDGLREVLSRRDDRLTHLLRLVEDLDDQLTSTLTRLASSESDHDVLEMQLGDARRHESELRRRLEGVERDAVGRAEERKVLEVEATRMRNRAAELEDAVKVAEEVAGGLRTKVEDLTRQMTERREEADQLRAAVGRAEEELERAKAENERRKVETGVSEAARVNAEMERDAVVVDLQSAKEEAERSARARAEAEAMARDVAAKLDTAQLRVVELEVGVSRAVEERDGAVVAREEAERGLKDASERAEAQRAEAERAARDAAEQKAAREELGKRLEELKEALAEGERKEAEVLAALALAEGDRDKAKDDQKGLVERLEAVEGKVRELEKLAEERAQRARDVEERLAEAVKDAQAKDEARGIELQEAHSVAEEVRAKFENGAARVRELEGQLVTMRETVQDKHAKMAELQTALQVALEGKAAAEAEMAVLAQRISVMDEAEEARMALMNELDDRLRREEDSGRERHLVMATLRATLDRQTEESAEREAEIDRLRDELQVKEVQMAQQEDDLLALRATVVAQAKAMEDMKGVVRRLESVVEETQKRVTEEIEKGVVKEKEILRLRGEVEAKTNIEEELRANLEGVTAELAETVAKLANQSDEVAALQATVASHASNLTSMQGLVNNLESAVTTAKEKLAASETAALEKDAIIQTLKETIDRETPLGIALRSDLARRNLELAERASQLAVRDKEVADLMESLSSHAKELDDLRQQVVVLKDIGPSKDSLITDLRGSLRDREIAVEAAHGRVAVLNATVEQQLETIASQARSLERLAALERELTQKQQRLDVLELDYEQSRKQLSDHGAQLQSLTVELDEERGRREKFEKLNREQAQTIELQAGDLVRMAMLGNAVAEKERLVSSLEKDYVERSRSLEDAKVEVQELSAALAEEKAGALELGVKLRDAQDQIAALRSSFSELQSTNEGLVSERDALLASSNGKDQQLLELNAQREVLEQRIASADQAKQDAERSAIEAKAKLAATLEERANWESILAQFDAAKDKYSATEAELATVKASLSAATDENTRTKAAAQSEIAVLQDSLAEQSDKVSELEDKLKDNMNDLEQLQSKQSVLEIQLSILKVERDALTKDVRDKQARVEALENEKVSLEAAIASLDLQRRGADSQVAEYSSRIENLLVDLESARDGWKAAEEARAELERTQARHEDLARQLEDLKSAAESRQNEIAAHEDQVAEISAERTKRETEARELGLQLEAAKATVSELQASLSARDRSLTEQAQAYASQAADYELRLQELQGKVSQLEKNAAAQQELRNIPASPPATARSAHLQEQIQKLQGQLDEAVKEKERLRRLAEVSRGGGEGSKWRELDEAHRENEKLRQEVENLREGRRQKALHQRLRTAGADDFDSKSRSSSPGSFRMAANADMGAQTDVSTVLFEQSDQSTQDDLRDPKPEMVSFSAQAMVESVDVGTEPDSAVAAALSTDDLLADFELQQAAHLSRLALLESEIAEKERLIKELESERVKHTSPEEVTEASSPQLTERVLVCAITLIIPSFFGTNRIPIQARCGSSTASTGEHRHEDAIRTDSSRIRRLQICR
ncbi:hypothetical protein M427DRAFT_384350 [Gonapodya prolifera JEL478]|uniref:Uncharacterized protein n=1 Tax=Gonapodya prolifera (strain JEL478) TaxID=1344416 RepID=A0A139A914_GONPJ|nr:hypothetical protein M427DRAFT_384350 [Gonapodya prolifera JEL478]|eukprot:KXS13227.1 hypothetical protein M427DRAFT_384350 [Gonapodya prolifera JEL478]